MDPNGATILILGLILHLLPYFMYTISEGYGETVYMRLHCSPMQYCTKICAWGQIVYSHMHSLLWTGKHGRSRALVQRLITREVVALVEVNLQPDQRMYFCCCCCCCCYCCCCVSSQLHVLGTVKEAFYTYEFEQMSLEWLY